MSARSAAVLLALALPLSGVPLTVAEAGPCDHGETNAGLIECRNWTFKQADARLNREYNKTMAILRAYDADTGTRGAPALVAAQRAWITFRDKDCDVPNALGIDLWTIGPVTPLDCLVERTETRTRELAELGAAFQ